jgi:hypothetical protein
MPRPEDSGGPFHPGQYGWSCVAFGVRENPRRPQQAPFRSCTSTSGCAVTPAASRIRCRRFVHLVRRVSTTPPWTQDALRVDGSSLPDRDFHPARDAKLVLARQRQSSPAAGSGSDAGADAVGSQVQRVVRPRFWQGGCPRVFLPSLIQEKPTPTPRFCSEPSPMDGIRLPAGHA